MGVMQEIREHLGRGRSSGELIAMGYAPGTVYRIQREMRQFSQRVPAAANLTGHLSIIEEDGEVSAVWHPETPIACPDCLTPVGHWSICRHCSKLIPTGCRCDDDSPAMREGFALGDLIQ